MQTSPACSRPWAGTLRVGPPLPYRTPGAKQQKQRGGALPLLRGGAVVAQGATDEAARKNSPESAGVRARRQPEANHVADGLRSAGPAPLWAACASAMATLLWQPGPALAEGALQELVESGVLSALPLPLQELLVAQEAASFGLFTGTPYLDAFVLGSLLFYGTASPGVGWGFIDTYFLSPIDRLTEKKVKGDNIQLGLRLGDGTFGTVYTGTLGDAREVIVKRAKNVAGAASSADAEEYMNRRIRRSPSVSKICAPYIGSYFETGLRTSPEDAPTLLWDNKGLATLEDLIVQRDFPLNVEKEIMGKVGTGDEEKRKARVIQRIMQQILQGVKSLHGEGIIHRDVKPANLVLMGGRFRFVDFGAAADLRVGYNYDPETTLLDPGYSPPEEFIMPESTPKPPPAPVAAALSPLLWAKTRPDLFDTYSCGIILLRMCCPPLRVKNAMSPTGNFQRQLKGFDYDLKKWRESCTGGQWDFSLLDMNGGAGWDLACKLVCKRNKVARGRSSAQEASLHPYLLF